VGRQQYASGKPRSKGAGTLGRAEPSIEEDRPFAEVRKTVHDALRLLASHRWGFFVPFSVVTCAAFVLSLYYPRTYRASTTFERRNDPVMMNLPMSSGAASFKYFRNTMVRDLTSVDYLSEVVENLGFTKDFPRDADGKLTEEARKQRDGIARSLAARIDVSTVSPSEQIDIVTITYTGPDPTIGRKLVDEAKRTYIRRTMVWIHNYLTDQRDYFKQESDVALAEVKEAQRQAAEYRLANPHADPANPGGITLRIAQLEMENRELVSRKREYEAELASFEEMLGATQPKTRGETARTEDENAEAEPVWLSPQAIRLADDIRKVNQDVDVMLRTRGMTTEHPDIQRMLSRRQWLEGELATQRQRDRDDPEAASRAAAVNPELITMAGVANLAVQGERTRLLVQAAAVKSKLKDVEISLQTNEQTMAGLGEAKRDVVERQEEFAEVMTRVVKGKQRQNQVEQTLATIEPAITAVEQNRLLQFSEGPPASGSFRPISPKSGTIVLLALLAGIATGVFFIVLAEVFDHVYRSTSQVAQSLGLPMLESIDEIVTSDDRRYIFLRKMVVSPLVVVCFLGLTGLTGSMAYLSIEQPWTYQRLSRIPHAVMNLFTNEVNSEG